MKNVSIVILNWNGKHFLERFLPSIIKYSTDPDTEIIIADNGSTDDSVAFTQKKYPDIRIIKLDRNYGFAEGYNRAFEFIDSRYAVILNSDVEVTENWLQPMVRFLDDHPDAAACMPKLRWLDYPEQFEYAGAAGGFIDILGFPFCRGRVFQTLEKDNGQYDHITNIFWSSGACTVIRTEIYKKLGGFDNNFFAHMEEIDLCWRIKNSGYNIYCVPQSVIYHMGGGSLPKDNPHKTYLNYRNNYSLLLKNLPILYIISVFLFRFFLDIVQLIRFFFESKPKHAMAVCKAFFHFLFKIPACIAFRLKSKAHRKIHKEMYLGSIAWRYFVLKKLLTPYC